MSLTLSDSSTKLLGNRISRYESYPIFFLFLSLSNLLSRYIENKHKVISSAFCGKGIFGETVDSCIILIKTVRIRRKTILVQARPVFFL